MFSSYISKHWRRNSDRERVASTREMFLIVVEALEHMEDHMTELTDALSNESGAIASLGTSLTTTLNDLQAEVSNLQSNPQIPAGVLDAVNAHVASLQSIAAQVAAADPGPAPAPAPAPASPGTDTPAPVDAGSTPAPVDTPAPGSVTPGNSGASAPVDAAPIDAGTASPPAPTDPGTVSAPAPTDGTPSVDAQAPAAAVSTDPTAPTGEAAPTTPAGF